MASYGSAQLQFELQFAWIQRRPPGVDADPLWTTSSADWLRGDVGITAGWGVVYLLTTFVQLRRLGPRGRR